MSHLTKKSFFKKNKKQNLTRNTLFFLYLCSNLPHVGLACGGGTAGAQGAAEGHASAPGGEAAAAGGTETAGQGEGAGAGDVLLATDT